MKKNGNFRVECSSIFFENMLFIEYVFGQLKNTGATRVAHGLHLKRLPESYRFPNAAQESVASVVAELWLQNFEIIKPDQLRAEK